MDREELWRRLIPAMEQDATYQQALQQIQEVEGAYLALLETLEPEKREVLERYIAACESADDAALVLAYQIGKTEAG